jgi:hypothetical protein
MNATAQLEAMEEEELLRRALQDRDEPWLGCEPGNPLRPAGHSSRARLSCAFAVTGAAAFLLGRVWPGGQPPPGVAAVGLVSPALGSS